MGKIVLSILVIFLPVVSMEQNSKLVRLWAGIDVPETIESKRLVHHRLQREMKLHVPDFKAEEKPHLTLIFFGETLEDEIEKINNSLSKAVVSSKIYGGPNIKVTFENKLILFGTAIALKVKENVQLNALRKDLANQLQKEDIPFENKFEFNPHVTLGRSKIITAKEMEQLPIDVNPTTDECNQFDVTHIILYKSKDGQYIPEQMYLLKPQVYYVD